ncbi:sensor histidine kinase [Actinoplanes solisilvae]|uniref:sensor histidine kinase n=1 Tax=Actinoplanes solisilvae TaxID=2486853 RepID=UPI000FD9F7EC|nr:ATP-binding protein [Actinoplanes solisilvae]
MKRTGLRTRVSAAFAVGAFALSACVTVVSYELTRSTLLRERERTAVRASYFDAAAVENGLTGPAPNVAEVLSSLDIGADRYVLVQRAGRWYSRSADTDARSAVPSRLQEIAAGGQAVTQRIRRDGVPALVVAVPLPGGTVFYEIVSLRELDRTLQLLALVLASVATMMAAGGAAIGWYVTRHALRPVGIVAGAARDIADGDLDTRLDPATEPDLAELAASFNHMADELARRLQRDRRFAADVSHELRSPLQTLQAAVSVIDRRRDGLDARSGTAVDLIVEEVNRFQALVGDLLELARSDQPAQRQATDVEELVTRMARMHRLSEDTVEILLDDRSRVWQIDARRVEQALRNLMENAVRYGGGPVALRAGLSDEGSGFLEVDDAGPGVPEQCRVSIFDRFVRGPAANARGTGDGTGLGLAIVAEHAASHRGSATVSDRPGGGSRFRIDLPGSVP